MKNIIFRCDYSKKLGEEHIIRCLSLAEELVKRACKIYFICRENDGDFTKLIESKYSLIILSKVINDDKHKKKLTNNFLGCDESIDALETLNSIKKYNLRNLSWLVIDHYGISKSWQDIFKAGYSKIENRLNSFKILVIDDLNNRNHICNILVNHNYLEKDNRYNNLVNQKCIKLIGPKFALLNDKDIKSIKLNKYSKLVDGMGKRRIVNAMMGPKLPFILREASIDDKFILFEMANDEDVRQNSFNSSKINFSTHNKWFKEKISNPFVKILLAEDKNKFIFGQIRFDREHNSNKIMIDISIDKLSRGYGLSIEILKKGIDFIKNIWEEKLIFFAEILIKNKASNACFAKVGFKKIKKDSNQINYWQMEI